MARTLDGRPARRLDDVRLLLSPAVLIRDHDPSGHGGVPVELDDPERVEAAAETPTVVDTAQRLRRPANVHRTAHLLGRDGRSLDEARDEVAVGFDELDDLRPDPGGRRSDGRLELGPALDPEVLRVLATDPQDVHAVIEGHLEVVIRDPAPERLDSSLPTGPDPREDGVELHAPIL